MNAHPSYATLDRAALGDAAAQQEIAAHVDACGDCRAYLDSVRAPAEDFTLAKVQRRVQLEAPKPNPLRYAAAAVLVAALGVAVATGLRDRDPVVTTKGAPSVAVYVKRGDTVFLWNGRAVLKHGDTIRLKIVPDGARWVQVMGGAGETLYQGALSPPETTLPVAWTLDDQGESETLRVAFGAREGRETSHVDLVIPKEAP